MSAQPAPWRVLGCKGCGSTVAEAALALVGTPYEREEVNYETTEGAARLIAAGNPLAQVPTVLLPDGSLLTETAAIVLYLDASAPGILLPPVADPQRAEALRWLMFLVSAVYPTFTYGDDPAKWVGDAHVALRSSTDEHRLALWRHLEGVVGTPWFLGARQSILDVYVSVMSRWRPRREWFAQHCPRLHAIAVAVDADPRLQQPWRANY